LPNNKNTNPPIPQAQKTEIPTPVPEIVTQTLTLRLTEEAVILDLILGALDLILGVLDLILGILDRLLEVILVGLREDIMLKMMLVSP